MWEGGQVRELSSDVLPLFPAVIDNSAAVTPPYPVVEPTAPVTVQERMTGEKAERAPSGTGRLG
jgi:hypothetical protein